MIVGVKKISKLLIQPKKRAFIAKNHVFKVSFGFKLLILVFFNIPIVYLTILKVRLEKYKKSSFLGHFYVYFEKDVLKISKII